MEDNFRLTLIIISAIVIAAISVHGFWTIRKNKNPYKLKTKKEPIDADSSQKLYDGSGFDQDGVSKIRVVGANPLNENEIPTKPAPAPSYDEAPIPKDYEEVVPSSADFVVDANAPLSSNTVVDEPDAVVQEAPLAEHIQASSPEVNIEPSLEPVTLEKMAPVYDEPVTQAKPLTVAKAAETLKKTFKSKKNNKQDIKRNQMEINFGDVESTVEAEPSLDDAITEKKQQETKPELKLPEVEPEVIVLSVVVPEGSDISGAALLPTLLTLGMKYGDMDIFHRHEDNAGNGKVTFSLANMLNPGTFNLDDIESFSTQGITLFMTLPNPGDAFDVFDQMLNSAKQLALEFKGQVLDDKRSVMTKQTEQHYISKIRDFERKHRISTL